MDNPVIKELAEKYRKSPAQIILRWHIPRGEILIHKSTHESRIKENIDLFDYHFDLTADEKTKIVTLDCDQRVGADPDDAGFLKKSTTYTNQNNAK